MQHYVTEKTKSGKQIFPQQFVNTQTVCILINHTARGLPN